MKLTEKKKLLIYKILLFAFAFIIAFLPSTASRNLEVNSRVIVEMLGLDEADGRVQVTAQYVMPTAGDNATTKDKVTVDGGNVDQAVEALSTALGRRAELGHCSMLILGSGLNPGVLGSLMTGTDVTADVYVSAAEGSAGELVGKLTDFMKKSGTTDAGFIAYSAKRSHVATTTLLNFLSDLGSASGTAFVPVVEMIEEKGGSGSASGGGSSSGENGSGGSGSSGGGSSGGTGATGMKTDKLALYNRDGRAGVLDTAAARGVAWVSADVEKSIVSANVGYGGKVYRGVSGRLVGKSADIDISPETSSAVIRVRAELDPKCDKFNSLNTSSAGDAREAIRAGFANAIRREIEAGYERAARLGCDPMFIVREFYRYAPDVYARGLGIADINVGVIVDVDIK